MRAIAVLLLAIAPAAWAGSVHKCKGADGAFVYQQTPCETEDTTVSSRVIPARDQVGTPPPSGYELLPAESAATDQRTHEGLPPDGYAIQPARDEARGYRCDDGRKQWIQEEPCPATVNRYHSSTGPAFVPSLGQHLNVTTTTRTQEAVKQEALDKADICDQVRSGADTSRSGSAGDSTYERNKMRDEHGC
jgi:hypothetical protein